MAWYDFLKKKSIVTSQQSDVTNFDKLKEEAEISAIRYQMSLEKASKSGNATDYYRAMQHIRGNKPNENAQKSFVIDPNIHGNGYNQNNSVGAISFDTMGIAANQPIIAAIINSVVSLCADFATPQSNEYGKGFIIKPKSLVGKEYSDIQKREIEWLTNFVNECGNGESHYDNDDFESYMRKSCRDSMVYDWAATEVVWNGYGYDSKKGQPTKFLAVDGSTIRIADNYNYYDNEIGLPSYVQLINGVIVNEYYRPEMFTTVRNDTTDINNFGYGKPEMATLIREITRLVWAMDYNANFFKNGSSPKGIGLIKDANSGSIEEFKQSWLANVAGIDNAWKTPFLEADSFEWKDLSRSNVDMEFNSWINFLIQLICSVYSIDPSLIGFHGLTEKSSVISGGDAGVKVDYSKDKFLYPLLRRKQKDINKNIIYPFSKEYDFLFVGLNGETKESALDFLIKELSSYKTLNEVRVSKGLPKVKGGDIILNPQYVQSYIANLQGSELSNAFIDNEDAEFKKALLNSVKL